MYKKLNLTLQERNKRIRQYKEKISTIFKSKSIKSAMRIFNELNEKFEELPEIIQDFHEKTL